MALFFSHPNIEQRPQRALGPNSALRHYATLQDLKYGSVIAWLRRNLEYPLDMPKPTNPPKKTNMPKKTTSSAASVTSSSKSNKSSSQKSSTHSQTPQTSNAPTEAEYVTSDEDNGPDNNAKSDASVDYEKDLGACGCVRRPLTELTVHPENAKKTWRSPVYSFFKPEVSVEWVDGRPCHFFPCAAHRCKTDQGGIRRYLDKHDKYSTANLTKHARRCFGPDAVKSASDGATKDQSKSVFDAFARRGQEPVTFSHRSLTDTDAR